MVRAEAVDDCVGLCCGLAPDPTSPSTVLHFWGLQGSKVVALAFWVFESLYQHGKRL